MPRPLRIGLGVLLVLIGGALIFSPLAVAAALHRPHETTAQMINLRASWGGTVLGLGAFVAWLPALRPLRRTILGLLCGSMAGIGLARAIGFALDGRPDTLQWVWIIAEITIVIACVLALRRDARRAAVQA